MAQQFTYPGVYISERRSGPAAVVGASTSTAAFIGGTREGAIDDPIDTFGFPDFETKFGTFTAASSLPTSVFNYYKNGGTRAVIVRVVADDAADAACCLTESVTDESLTPDPAFGAPSTYLFVGANALVQTPVNPGSVTVDTDSGTGEQWTDNGDGTLTNGVTGTGTIDYATGDMTLTFDAPPGSVSATVSYDYQTFCFDLKWPGVAGNEYTVVVTGDPLFLDNATASFSRFVVEVQRTDATTQIVDVRETFSELVFDDPTSGAYVVTVMNDDLNGSNLINVVATGNNENPSALAGAQVSAEVLVETPAYDGAEKAFTYALANPVNITTLEASFTLVENGGVPLTPTNILGQGDGTDSPTIVIPGSPIAIADDATFAILIPQSTADPLFETFTLATPGDGSGTLTGDSSSTGTVNFATGAVTVDMSPSGDTSLSAPVGSDIVGSYTYEPHVIVDNGSGAVAIQAGGSGPGIWELDANGTNTIDYATGVMALTWRKTTNPLLGPSDAPLAVTQTVDYYSQSASSTVNCPFTGGLDGSPIGRSNVTAAALAGDQRGLFALDKTEELLQVDIPDFESDPLVSSDLIDYCDGRQDRFAIISVPLGLDTSAAITYKTTTLNKSSNRAAIYYPHIKITDPVTNKAVDFPPGGHIAGIYARTDVNRNVSKAPAGTVDGAIRFSLGLERILTFTESGQLNLNNVNALMDDPSIGRVVWGARTLETVGEFRYIQMRRLFMFVEKSVFNSTQVYVFESNTPSLRAQIKAQIETFLLGLFNANFFSGSTPADAFFVVDKTTDADVVKGIVRMEVGMAPTRPAEFISFTFQQKTVENA